MTEHTPMAPGSVPSTERHSPPTSAAPFFRAVPFALAASLPLWALILLFVRWVA